jgi:hypothetical protein
MAESRSRRAHAQDPAQASTAAPPDAEATRAQPSGPLCQVAMCPICTTVMLLGDIQPELMGHLLAAGREMLLAMRTIIDLRLQEPPDPPKTIQRLHIT